jgi:hypothetical protein
MGFPHGREAKALGLHSKGVGSIPRPKVIFYFVVKIPENFYIFTFLCGEHDGAIIFSWKILEELEKSKNLKKSFFQKFSWKNNSAIVFLA